MSTNGDSSISGQQLPKWQQPHWTAPSSCAVPPPGAPPAYSGPYPAQGMPGYGMQVVGAPFVQQPIPGYIAPGIVITPEILRQQKLQQEYGQRKSWRKITAIAAVCGMVLYGAIGCWVAYEVELWYIVPLFLLMGALFLGGLLGGVFYAVNKINEAQSTGAKVALVFLIPFIIMAGFFAVIPYFIYNEVQIKKQKPLLPPHLQ